ncbi:MAG: PDZ domain-containing protein [Acidobacteriia bacterium]|nr:PDZ domain-containing protein [Terriglobia bacterium]
MSNRVRLFLITASCVVVFYVLLGGLLGKSDTSSEKTYRDLGVYSEVLSRIKSDYVTEPDLRKVTGGAIRGLLEALDPYSTYFTPQEYQEYLKQPEAGAASVGIFLAKRMGFATVVAVLPGSPAEKAGVKPGDLIDRVEDSATRELSVVQLQRMLAGPAGSTVSLTLVHEARGEPQKVEITRAVLSEPPTVGKMAEDNAGYIRVASFSKGQAAEIAAKLKELTAAGADKVVLDLRNCAGGNPEEAVKTASLFLEKGVVAYLEGQRYPRQDLNAIPSAHVCALPLVVMINQSTAGPAELVASAIQGNKRGEAVGVRSFGVGVYQKLIPMDDGSALLLSVAKYYGPDGKAIQDNGVTPNVVDTSADDSASADDDDNEPTEPEHFGDKNDQELHRAIEVLKQKTTKAA